MWQSSALLNSCTGYNGTPSAKIVNDSQALLFIARPEDTSNHNPIGMNVVIKNFNDKKTQPQTP